MKTLFFISQLNLKIKYVEVTGEMRGKQKLFFFFFSSGNYFRFLYTSHKPLKSDSRQKGVPLFICEIQENVNGSSYLYKHQCCCKEVITVCAVHVTALAFPRLINQSKAFIHVQARLIEEMAEFIKTVNQVRRGCDSTSVQRSGF